MLTCKEATTAIASGELDRAGLGRRLSVWLHLAICGYCRCYARQIRKLGDAARRLLAREAGDGAALEALEERLVRHCHEPADDGG